MIDRDFIHTTVTWTAWGMAVMFRGTDLHPGGDRDMTLTCPDRTDNPDDPRHWMMYATCYGRWAEFDPDQICAKRGWDHPTSGRIDPIARRQCAPCPVKAECAAYALTTAGGIIAAGWYLPHRTWESARKDDNVARVRDRLTQIAAGAHL